MDKTPEKTYDAKNVESIKRWAEQCQNLMSQVVVLEKTQEAPKVDGDLHKRIENFCTKWSKIFLQSPDKIGEHHQQFLEERASLEKEVSDQKKKQ